jgi:hypothetical protein
MNCYKKVRGILDRVRAELNIVSRGDARTLHHLRRYPEGVYEYWMGHAPADLSDLYDKVKEDVAFRREWAEKCGIGFELFPLIVPNVPRKQPKPANSLAA